MAPASRPGPRRKKRSSYHHGNLREALLQAAVKRIGESRDFDFRLRDLAADCGVQLAACYRHFAAKGDVLVELARRGFVALGERLSGVPGGPDGARALAGLGASYIEFARDNPVLYSAMFHPALAQRGAHPEKDAAAAHTLLRLQSAVEHALGPSPQNSHAVGRTVFQAWAGVHGYASLLVARDPAGSDPMIDPGATQHAIAAFTEALTKGILARS